jgi:hypothetical protein
MQRYEKHLFLKISRTYLGFTLPPIEWASNFFTRAVKQLGSKVNHSPPCSAVVKNVWSYNSIPLTPSWSQQEQLCPFFYHTGKSKGSYDKIQTAFLRVVIPCGIVGDYRSSEEPVSSTFVVQDYGSITRWCRCSE